MSLGKSIPVVDFEDVFSSINLTNCSQVKEIHSAFTSVGFVFVKNHGIDRKLVLYIYIYIYILTHRVVPRMSSRIPKCLKCYCNYYCM